MITDDFIDRWLVLTKPDLIGDNSVTERLGHEKGAGKMIKWHLVGAWGKILLYIAPLAIFVIFFWRVDWFTALLTPGIIGLVLVALDVTSSFSGDIDGINSMGFLWSIITAGVMALFCLSLAGNLLFPKLDPFPWLFLSIYCLAQVATSLMALTGTKVATADCLVKEGS